MGLGGALALGGILGLLLNGVFVGATVTGPIRNALLLAFAVYLASLWLFVPQWRNRGLWLSFLLFTLMRSVVLGAYLPQIRTMAFRETVARGWR